MSRVVAVAGGSGNLGRTIVEAILADGKFTPIILSRKVDTEKEKEIGARFVPVDYGDVESLIKTLESQNVEIVISVLNTMNSSQIELNLIEASDKATSTKRFIPSVWGIEFPQWAIEMFPPAGFKVEVTKVLEKTSLEWTSWSPGYFLDWWVTPHIKSHMATFALVVDVANKTAAIPGSGDVPVALTYTFDLAKFVAASLSLPKWEKTTYCIGDKVTMNELLAIAEEARGAKFTVTTDEIETLKKGQVTELPSHSQTYAFFPKQMLQPFLALFGLMFAEGVFDMKPAHTINGDFPDIKTHTVKELVTEAWKGK
ncbi:uncharacterized protein FOBCDRAFT_253251 [Fusarium oxysporum Fo47]|uniref:NmrA-like domain-containing protein n=2 Tax=Fusarium oxysporum TaxID=5507 RepID=W9JTU2_FUSOX|nr:uncharacterized protein FOBCDRAFT_253251 [Fusarium oxysporum Fo47]EWZ33060.1 hypothetical protein FOZG_14555 [Fusarium oxysporum Fo47]QKD60194.1 hypothetical protein FOBCDRAFT_253251 [Fusarium oxysporum Fo47]